MSRTWTVFEKMPLESLTMVKNGKRVDIIDTLKQEEIESYRAGEVEWWQNNLYCVQINRGKYVLCSSMDNAGKIDIGWPEMIWLSIRRRERARLPRDWRDLQRIKNELVGEEHEAVELFPAEARKVDESDQFHLWVFASVESRFPFGYLERSVLGPRGGGGAGGSQREFEEGDPHSAE